MGWHTHHLIKALVALKDCVKNVELILHADSCLGICNVLEEWQQRGGVQWVKAGQLTIRVRGIIDKLDLFHGPNFKMRSTRQYGGLLTIHDLWLDRFPHYSTKLLGQRLFFCRTRRTAWRARRVVERFALE